ncbi:MAG: hypothetical protein ACKV2V_00290 [Blastocatellia bacterium]
MNYIVCLMSMLLVCGPVSRGETYPVTTIYDRARDITTARLELHTEDRAPTRLIIEANAVFPGKEPGPQARFWLTIIVMRG